MTGPYVVRVFLARRPSNALDPGDLSLSWETDRDLLLAGEDVSYRYYSSGHGETLLGTARAAAFAVGGLLSPGEEAYFETYGREPSRGLDAPGSAPAGWTGSASVRRDADGRLLSSLGSRWSRERYFRGA